MSRVSRGFRLAGWLIRFLFILAVFFVIALLLWRVFISSTPPKTVEGLTLNDSLHAAYEQKGDELTMFNQNLDMITRADHNSGYFAITDCVFIPDANQIQILFRYNNSTIRALTEDYGLTETPDRESDLYDVTLLLATDLTPDVAEDNLGNDPSSVKFTRIHPTTVTADTKNMYNYRRMVFDLGEAGLSLKDLTDSKLLLAVYADIYYNQDIQYDKDAYGTLCLYDHLMEARPVELDRRDEKALQDYKPQ